MPNGLAHSQSESSGYVQPPSQYSPPPEQQKLPPAVALQQDIPQPQVLHQQEFMPAMQSQPVALAAAPAAAAVVAAAPVAESLDPKVNGLRVIKELAQSNLITADERGKLTKKVLAQDTDTLVMIAALQSDHGDLAENLRLLL